MTPALLEITDSIKKAIHGKDKVIHMVLCAILAGGHVLLEDIPGVGKTTLVTALAKTMSLSHKRIQFTPDVLPSDLTGFNMLDKETGGFRFHEGAVYTNLFLADEINRTSPKTQSALLEVMEEGRATVDGVTRELPHPFFVIATQNPIGASGTQKLPESQLDRFMVRLSMGYPDHDSAVEILKGDSHKIIRELSEVVSAEEVVRMQQETEDVYVEESLLGYIISLTEATRDSEAFSLGLSPRGSIALLKMAKSNAYLSGRTYVTPEDIFAVYGPVANHRVLLSMKSRAAGQSLQNALNEAFRRVPVPKLSK